MQKTLALAASLLAIAPAALGQFVTQEVKSATTLTSSANPAFPGAPITLTASVTGGTLRPAGTVAFLDGATAIPGCEAAVVGAGGQAQCTTSALGLGTHALRAAYGGSASYSASTSAVLSQSIVTVAPTSVTVTTSHSPSIWSDTLSFQLQVTSPAGKPEGTASFYLDNVAVDSCMNVPISLGIARCVRNDLTVGTHVMAAQYNGSASYSPSASAVAQVVKPRPHPRVDFNGDYKADLVWTNSDGRAAHWIMDGPTQVDGWAMMGQASAWTLVQVGDFNGDGKTDVLWRHTDGSIAMWLVDGKTQIGGARLLGPGNDWYPAAVADFNGDGKADIVWRKAAGNYAVWLMDGTTQIGGARLLDPSAWQLKHVADFNGDGKADILWENFADGRVAMWIMDGAAQVGGALLYTPDPAVEKWEAKLVGDLDGDGCADIVWVRPSARESKYTLMRGTSQVSTVPLSQPYSIPVSLGDFEGAGRASIIWQDSAGAVFAAAPYLATTLALAPAGSFPTRMRVADFYGSRRGGMVWERSDGAVFMVTTGPLGLEPPTTKQIFSSGTTWRIALFD